MRSTRQTRMVWAGYTGIVSLLALFLPSCAEPVHVAWNDSQGVIEPQVPPPQGELDVYSESYVMYDADVPRNNRRPVDVYSVDEQLVASEHHPFGDGPIRFDLTPGHYIIASESHMQERRVQADVQDGRTTVVAESAFEHAPLLSSATPVTNTQVAVHQLSPSH